MRRTVLLFLLSGSLLCASASGANLVSAADAPSATPSLLRKLNRGAETVAIVVGIKDGTPSPHALLANPDSDGEPERRGIRVAAQKRLADEFTPSRLAVKNYYESFSMLAGTATREAAISLASHPDVAWVDLDREARPFQAAPQASQTLIRSDQVNSVGIRGLRQVVVVIDTGVDYLVQALGGAPFPNQRVIGGTDLGDHDSDPQDCDGHGTSIAATIVVVAPDVQIVALKIFSSTNTSNSSCKDTAEFSDIYAALSWCIVHQAELGITVINISLGGEFDDSLPHGFCDADDPGSAAAIDGARAAGMPVFVAAGNDALTNATATPGCTPGAISIGGVYSESRNAEAWSDDAGGILCTDRGITADTIICFSNSMTTLSLLAPGAFWSVVTRGGGLDRFSGTSPATASASGAAALLLQSHPGQSPAWVEAVLTLTGKPIADSRNGVVKNRIDTLAAVQLDPTTFGVASPAAVPIPDGTGSATATVAISGFTHPIAAVQVWAKIAHSEPAQIRLTLIGPDGTSVILHDRTGQSQYSINSVYGRTDATAQSLGAFSGKQGNGVWTLTVEDLAAGTSGSIRGFAVLLIPLNDRQLISKRTAAGSRTPKKVSPRL